MSNLTMDKLRADMFQMAALGPYSSLRIQPSDIWPRDYVADAVYSYLPHPFWRWLWRVALRREHPPSMERGYKIFADKPMIKYRNTIYCSHRQARDLERAILNQARA